MAKDHPGQKVSETPSQPTKAGFFYMAIHA
jgi:hypothetical protein